MRGKLKVLVAIIFLGFHSTNIVAANHRTVIFTSDIIAESAVLGKLFTLDLTTLLSNPASGTVNWSASSDMPTWLVLDNAHHTLSGTPSVATSETQSFRLIAADTENESIARIDISVISPPQWVTNAIDLGIQNEGVPFQYNLNSKIINQAVGAVTFSAENLPEWMTLNPNGSLFGTPQRVNVGEYRKIILTATSIGGSSKTTGYGQVNKVLKAPTWTAPAVALADAIEDQAYSQPLAPFIDNPDKARLTFTIVSPPSWIHLSSAGSLSGTPHASNLGTLSLTVSFAGIGTDGTQYPAQTSSVTFKVIHVNHPPQWTSNPITLPDGATGVAYRQDLGKSVSDPDVGDTLTISKLSGPAWASISSSGVISGTPDATSVGLNTFHISATDPHGASSTTTVRVNIVKSIQPPHWIAKPTILPDAKEDVSSVVDLMNYAKSPDNEPLTFTVLSGPSWLSLSPDGILQATPHAAQVGIHTWSIQVSDNISGNDVTNVILNVTHVNHPPQWVLNPVRLSTPEEKAFNISLSPYATDPDKGDTLSFQLTAGPSWAQVSTNGVISGTPPDSNIGDNNFKVRVLDQGGLFADGTVTISVTHVNHPPKWTVNPLLLPNAKQAVPYSQSVASYATDPDVGDVLTFTKVSGPAWVEVHRDGSIAGTPHKKDIGKTTFRVRVMDPSNASAVVTVNTNVDNGTTPPRWRQNPILLNIAYQDKPYLFEVAPLAVDDNGNSLTFTKVSGPTWIKVGPSGQITGTPRKADVGTFSAVLAVSNGFWIVQAAANGQVGKAVAANIGASGTQTDITKIDTPRPGSNLENLWIIDNSKESGSLIKSFRENLHYYFDALTSVQIHHRGLLVSADAHKWDGLPIKDEKQGWVFSWNENNTVDDFIRRMDQDHQIEVTDDSFSTPLWTMFRFYDRLTSLTEIYQTNYFLPHVPLDVFIVTANQDHYENYSKSTPQHNWTPEDYVNHFNEFHAQRQKSMRISVVAPANPIPDYVENAYHLMVSKTNGVYYPDGPDALDMKSVLQDYAKRAIFRSHVYSKTNIVLSKVPIDPSSIQLKVSGVDIPGNTGEAENQWTYDASTNSVFIYWFLIDHGDLHPGDEIRLVYR